VTVESAEPYANHSHFAFQTHNHASTLPLKSTEGIHNKVHNNVALVDSQCVIKTMYIYTEQKILMD